MTSFLSGTEKRTLFYFNDSVPFDDGFPTGATEVQEIVDLPEPMKSNFDEEMDNETLIITATLSNALHCLETVKKYLMQQDVNDAVSSSLHNVEKYSG
ncbi:hypothetical protein TNCV_3798641 [Trichonephila clavipes]|nr:hypothetical protein TNCV_3798641 [Trichonephila clavipes]